ncbi:MAG: sigma 54-interacting transcriptional regulator [Myxococcota bacterium]
MVDSTIEPDPERAYSRPNPNSAGPLPHLTIVHHADLARVGATVPPSLFEGGRWVTVGRLEPQFIAPVSHVTSGALDDPHISRRQLKVRWLAERSCFEVEVTGRLPVTRVELPEEPLMEPQLIPLEGRTRLEPNTLLALGHRALLRLHHMSWFPPEDNRMGMIGETDTMWEVRHAIDRASRFQKPVLVLGPTGAGKELVARALHGLSERAEETFLPINSAALPEHLVESLLFGHKKGAFTGAHAQRDGAFLEANGGSLFMDEIGELSLEIQTKLLRVLQEGRVTPVGSHQTYPVDVRLIAATNRDLKAEVAAGNLRADFYYRVAVHVIRLPSLHERRWDVPMLFVRFLSLNRERHPSLGWLWGKPSARRTPIPMEFILEMLQHPWPGNVRELQNLAEKVCAQNLDHDGRSFVHPNLEEESLTNITAGGLLTASSLVPELPSSDPGDNPGNITLSTPKESWWRSAKRTSQSKALTQMGVSRKTVVNLVPNGFRPQHAEESMEAYLQHVEGLLTDALLELLDQLQFNQVHVANQLNISRNTLVRLMKALGIPRPNDLDENELAQVLADNGGDVISAAHHFGIAPRAMQVLLNHHGPLSRG